MAKLMILGGSGIIGTPTAELAQEQGHDVLVVAKDAHASVPTITFDKRSPKVIEDLQKICDKHGPFDGVIDICSYNASDAQHVYEGCKEAAKQFVVLSTALVYDRSTLSYERIKSAHALARKGMYGGYVDNKLALEEFWQSIEDRPKTILRPYHILGKGSLLGCLPVHNRDPHLLERILAGKPIHLCDGGRVPLNIVHPQDIGRVALAVIGDEQTFNKAFNVVNPEEVIAREYYEVIGEAVGKKVEFFNIPGEDVWKNYGGWHMTTLPHLYDVSDLERAIGFVPAISLKLCVADALATSSADATSLTTPIAERMNLLPSPKTPSYFTRYCAEISE